MNTLNHDFDDPDDETVQNRNEKVSVALEEQKAEHIIRKVAVSWNKFIKMKQTKFTKDYEIVEEIGRGGFGAVYKVLMKNSGHRVFRAAKKIMKEPMKKEEHASLLNEMAIMISLDHPNITKLYEVYEHPNYYVMVLELCEGGELLELIASHQIQEKQARNIMRQILSAINYMHNQRIVHRDIKPENILFEKRTKLVKIIDFGISVRIEKEESLKARLGTPYYIAPEVLRKCYDHQCDLWSVGIVLYMIIFRRPPFKGTESMEIMQSILKD